jgi:CDP-6-deoxy-D-xylo-4-hexulose-3-dehydrase
VRSGRLRTTEKLDGMVEIRRRNARLFVDLFRSDDRFIIQQENGRSSWFSFTLVLNPAIDLTGAGLWLRCARPVLDSG